MRQITSVLVTSFEKHLINEEKSQSTVRKYVRSITFFMHWLCGREITKALATKYKNELCETHAPSSVNGAIAALNSFFCFAEWYDIRIKALKIQRRIFSDSDKLLTKNEYKRLLAAAKNKQSKNDKKYKENKKNGKSENIDRLYFLMQTLCSTGIRISELRYITVSAIKARQAVISCKGKTRIVILPTELCKILSSYVKKNKIKSGSIFVSRNGKPLDRSYIWRQLKALCAAAGVNKSKVFPHNFRHLFARTFYAVQKDIVRLADILGHSSVNTTRIYTTDTGDTCRKQLRKLGLLQL